MKSKEHQQLRAMMVLLSLLLLLLLTSSEVLSTHWQTSLRPVYSLLSQGTVKKKLAEKLQSARVFVVVVVVVVVLESMPLQKEEDVSE